MRLPLRPFMIANMGATLSFYCAFVVMVVVFMLCFCCKGGGCAFVVMVVLMLLWWCY